MRNLALLIVAGHLLVACDEPEPETYATGRGASKPTPASCDVVTAVPEDVAVEMGIDTGFYRKYCSAYGIPIVGSGRVSDEAARRVARLASGVLEGRKDIRDALHDRYFTILVAALTAGEAFEDLPQLRDAGFDLDGFAGVGPAPASPTAAAHDSNVLCFGSDRVRPGHIFVHEIGHAVHLMGLNFVDPTFDERLLAAFHNARETGLWAVDDAGSRMGGSHLEYWAHGVEIWFGLRSEPVGGVRELLLVTSRDDLLDHDPELHALLVEAFADAGLPERLCPGAG